MTQRPSSASSTGLHVGIIMDGNGRWAERQGLSRAAGHREGADGVRRIVEAAARIGHASPDVLEDAVARLHDGHWAIVNLRSELDAHIAARRSGKEPVRSCRFATGSKPVRSRFSSTGSLTRPAGL